MITYRGLISATNSDTVGSLPDESEISEGTFDVTPFVTPLGHSLVFLIKEIKVIAWSGQKGVRCRKRG